MDGQTADVDVVAAAYRLLGVPHDSSPLRIRRAYRALAKTWHPDKFPPGTRHHEYATERMGDMNNAFQTIRHAPLRYQFETVRTADWLQEREARRRREITDRIEYVVRVACGAILGSVVSLSLVLHGFPLTLALAVPVITAVAAAMYGDVFWRWIFKLWWLWAP
jgi:hypothetical protein